MIRSVRLVPSSRSFSKICSSAGALIEIHPDTGAPCGAFNGTTSDAVAPG